MEQSPPTDPPPSSTSGRTRRVALGLFALSFVPYALPVDQRPRLYRDGRTHEEIDRRRQEQRVLRSLYPG